MFSGRGKKLNDDKEDFTMVFQISNTLLLVLHQNLSIFCEEANQYIHFVHFHIVRHWG